MTKYVVVRRDGKVAYQDDASGCTGWISAGVKPSNGRIHMWETFVGAQKFASMNGGTVTLITELDGAVK